MKTKLLFLMFDRPNYPGGPIINYTRLLPELYKKGYDIHLLVMYQGAFPNASDIEKSGIKIYAHPYIKESLKAVRWILKQVEEIQPDIFIPDISTPGCFAGKWVKECGIPVVNSHRSDDELNWGKALYFSDPKFGFTTTAVFCVSEYLLNALTAKINNPAIITDVIPSGVMIPDCFSNQNPEKLRVVYSGRVIHKQKRILDIMEAFAQAARLYSNTIFTVIGDGPDLEKCKNIVEKHGLSDKIKFTGMLEGESYKKELAKHDITVSFSDYEGAPGSLMDAMSCGLIPVCYSYPGAEELVIHGETGLIIKDREKEFFKELAKLKGNYELRKKISKNARKHIVDNFSIDICLSKWQKLIEKLIKLNYKKKRFNCPADINLPLRHPLLIQHY